MITYSGKRTIRCHAQPKAGIRVLDASTTPGDASPREPAGLGPAAPLTRQLYRIPEVMVVLSLKRSTVYELLRSGRLRSVKEGNSRLVSARAIAEYVALLESEAGVDTAFWEAS